MRDAIALYIHTNTHTHTHTHTHKRLAEDRHERHESKGGEKVKEEV